MLMLWYCCFLKAHLIINTVTKRSNNQLIVLSKDAKKQPVTIGGMWVWACFLCKLNTLSCMLCYII